MILHRTLPYDPFATRPLPGTRPLDPADWLIADEVFAAQMALRAQLIAERRAAVIALDPAARPAADELLGAVLDAAYPGAGEVVTRPDGERVAIRSEDPLGTIGHLVQEDFCLLEKRGAAHVLTGAVLCFPSRWRLSEKFLRPLAAIHAPVASYDDAIAARVQRLFDGVRPGAPLWRFNTLLHDDARLFQPMGEAEPRDIVPPEARRFLRSERQCLLRLPRSGAVVFSIHTYVLERGALARRGTA